MTGTFSFQREHSHETWAREEPVWSDKHPHVVLGRNEWGFRCEIRRRRLLVYSSATETLYRMPDLTPAISVWWLISLFLLRLYFSFPSRGSEASYAGQWRENCGVPRRRWRSPSPVSVARSGLGPLSDSVRRWKWFFLVLHNEITIGEFGPSSALPCRPVGILNFFEFHWSHHVRRDRLSSIFWTISER